jgi:hypothetical protein
VTTPFVACCCILVRADGKTSLTVICRTDLNQRRYKITRSWPRKRDLHAPYPGFSPKTEQMGYFGYISAWFRRRSAHVIISMVLWKLLPDPLRPALLMSQPDDDDDNGNDDYDRPNQGMQRPWGQSEQNCSPRDNNKPRLRGGPQSQRDLHRSIIPTKDSRPFWDWYHRDYRKGLSSEARPVTETAQRVRSKTRTKPGYQRDGRYRASLAEGTAK